MFKQSSSITIITGHVAKKPELRYTAAGKGVIKVSVPVTTTWLKDGEKQEKTVWNNITFFGTQAENLEKLLEKGTMVTITGTLTEPGAWLKDGNAKASIEIMGNECTLLGKKPVTEQVEEPVKEVEEDEIPF